MKHTPAPWDYDGEFLRSLFGEPGPLNSSPVKVIATLEDLPEWEANAQLMAAAPDLLETLQLVIPDLEHYVNTHGAGPDKRLEQVLKVIKKATGGQT